MSEATDTPETPDRSEATPPRFDAGTPTIAMVVSVTVLFVAYLWPTYAYVLRLSTQPPVQWDGPLMIVSAWSTAVLCLVPFTLVAIALTGIRPRWIGATLGVVTIAIGELIVAFDAMLTARYGRHLSEVLRFADEGGSTGPGDLVGGLGGWVALLARGGLIIAAGVAIAWAIGAAIVRFGRRRPGSKVLDVAKLGAVSLVGMFAMAPLFDLGFETRPAAIERLYGAVPIDLRFYGPDKWETTSDDPRIRSIDDMVKSLYASRFVDVIRPHPVDESVKLEGDRPNVYVIVVESFRYNALTPETMPRLSAWAKRGLRCNRHYAGSYYSEQGLFALLYGRLPLSYQPTLDSNVPPQLLHSLRANGYELTYTTGHPEVWNGRELFMNDVTFDRVVRQTEGDWPQWDRDAVNAAVETLTKPGDDPRMVLTFLISSHFEYRYPPEYEKHTPVERTIKWEIGSTAHREKLTDELREPLLNRYRNCMGFLDDLIVDAIERLDPAKNIIVVTGDHGESMLEDGRYGHGFAFSDIQTRVPMVIVGPGIEPGEIDAATWHADLPRSLLDRINGGPVSIEHQNGRDWFDPAGREAIERDEVMLCFSRFGDAEGILIRGNHQLGLKLDMESPRAVVTGAVDVSGDVIPTPPGDFPDTDAWRATASRLMGSNP